VEFGTHWRMTVNQDTALQALDGSCFFIFKTACCRASQGT